MIINFVNNLIDIKYTLQKLNGGYHGRWHIFSTNIVAGKTHRVDVVTLIICGNRGRYIVEVDS